MPITTWQGALLAKLRANVTVTGLIGQKSFWEVAPQGTQRPYVTLFDVTQERPQTFSGFDLELLRVQIDVWTNDYLSKNTIMDAVLAALVPGSASANGHIFQRADVEIGPRDVAGEVEGETIVFRKTVDLIIPHTAV